MRPYKDLCSEDEFIRLFRELGGTELAKHLGCSKEAVYSRRRSIEGRRGVILSSPNSVEASHRADYESRIPLAIENGFVLVGSDAHYWPGDPSPAHRGFVYLCRKLKPAAVILNGDVFDGASASRHARIMWAKGPSLKEELGVVEARTDEIRLAAPAAHHYWLLGNHCMRFETKLANQAPEFEGVPGFRLSDHFPHWKFGISLWINDEVVVKHRFKGGIHATHNNTLNAGKTMVTGHLHSLKVTPFSDYNGTRYGVDTGTLSDPYGEHAAYAEDNPLNHRSGFIVLSFRNKRLLWPEIAAVVDKDHIQFRGELIKV